MATPLTLARDPEGLAIVGETLYGERWRAALARDLGVSLRLVQYWAEGEKPIPLSHWHYLAELLEARASRCSAVARAVRAGV